MNFKDFEFYLNSEFWQWLKGEIEKEIERGYRELYNEGRASVRVEKINSARARIKAYKSILDKVESEYQNLLEEDKDNGKKDN